MWYKFDMYNAKGIRKDIVEIYADSESEAWNKASDYAYDHGYEDYDKTHINRIRHERYRG